MEEKEKICQFADNTFQHKKCNNGNYTLILGAGASISSGIKGWAEQCKEYCMKNKLTVNDDDYISALKEYFEQQHNDKCVRYNTLYENFLGKVPSYGYKHLATLIKNGYFKTIITTNYDDLLEQALLKIIPISKIKIFVRGEVPDDYIANYIQNDISHTINIIKLHGDIRSNIIYTQDEETRNVNDKLRNVLCRQMTAGSVIVGSELSDINLYKLFIYSDKNNYNVFVNPKIPSSAQLELLNIDKKDNPYQYIQTDFDTFFSILCKEIQKREFKDTTGKRLLVEKEILEKKEKGTNYVSASYLSTLAEDLWRKIKKCYRQKINNGSGLFAFIDDPVAPGGMEMKRLLSEQIQRDCQNAVIETIKVAGLKTRYDDRIVRSELHDYGNNFQPDYIMVIDAISFSGNTIKLAIDKYKEAYPLSEVKGAVVFLGEQLKEDDDFKNIFYLQTTDRHEIYFPWGMTQATKLCLRNLQSGDVNIPKVVKIDKRKWGTIEVLEEENNCSVRILTIEANQKLSFQRHFERDELFVSLDDNIGLEICAESLDNSHNKPLHEIREIKSLVLEKGDYILIPRGVWHRTKANRDRARLLEIGYGIYDQDNDIERFEETL